MNKVGGAELYCGRVHEAHNQTTRGMGFDILARVPLIPHTPLMTSGSSEPSLSDAVKSSTYPTYQSPRPAVREFRSRPGVGGGRGWQRGEVGFDGEGNGEYRRKSSPAS